jgi:tetratricopeptide (TPR) repeat protein
MSDPIMKGEKRSASRPVSRRTAAASKQRGPASRTSDPKPLSSRASAKKAPPRKAQKAAAPKEKAKATKKVASKSATRKKITTKAREVEKPKTAARKRAIATKPKSASVATKKRPTVAAKPIQPKKSVIKAPLAKQAQRQAAHTQPPARAHNFDESAALHAFERAYKEFSSGHFLEARDLFRSLLEKGPGGSDVIARTRTYLAITESRLKADSSLPKDADSLYDRGVIELNRGRFVAAQEMFEQALNFEPHGAHIHYGLAAARARLGAVDQALGSLVKAIDLQPSLRLRAQHDIDLTPLRSEPDFDRLVFTQR